MDTAQQAVPNGAVGLESLPTPTLVLDEAKLRRNARAMRERADQLGVALRPHMKTAKSAAVARAALAGAKGTGGITVSTLKEADYFLANGIRDMTYAVCIAPQKLGPAAALAAKGADLKILTDDVGVAKAMAASGLPLKVLIEIDCGEHRTGLSPDSPKLPEIAGILAVAKNVTLQGVLTHAGHSYACRTADAMERVAEDERAAAVHAAGRLREAGFPCPTVSVGSTPTARFAKSLEGVTEMRPGVYLLGDLFQAGIGSCGVDDIAATVLATVIAHRPAENALLIDAGGLALSKDRATAALPKDLGYGLVCDARMGTPVAGLKVDSVHQEHGHVVSESAIPFERFPIGAKVRVMPNHVCMTAAAYDCYHVVDGRGRVTARWDRCNGW